MILQIFLEACESAHPHEHRISRDKLFHHNSNPAHRLLTEVRCADALAIVHSFRRLADQRCGVGADARGALCSGKSVGHRGDADIELASNVLQGGGFGAGEGCGHWWKVT